MSVDTAAVDRHLGEAIRLRRRALGLSQQALAQRIGISFQQVQKYESGANRISASTLYVTARALGLAPGAFFVGLDAGEDAAANGIGVGDVEDLVRDMLAEPGGPRMAAAWLAAPSAAVRADLLGVASAVARPSRR
jgi:transcriptional regulator with XRE-family HTH domain